MAVVIDVAAHLVQEAGRPDEEVPGTQDGGVQGGQGVLRCHGDDVIDVGVFEAATLPPGDVFVAVRGADAGVVEQGVVDRGDVQPVLLTYRAHQGGVDSWRGSRSQWAVCNPWNSVSLTERECCGGCAQHTPLVP